MHVTAVEDERGARRFLELPARLYRDDPLWRDESYSAAEADLAATSSFLRYSSMRAFLCMHGDGALGRIAAFVNPRLVDGHGAPLGQVGYFEANDDERVAGELFASAFRWLRGRGAAQVVGPMAGGAHRPHRLMTAGFDRTPFFREPRSRPYYARLFEAAGFARLHAWYGYDWTRAELGLLVDRLAPIAARAERARQYRLESLGSAGPGVAQRLYALLDRAWEGHTGYAPPDLEEVAGSLAPLLAMIDRECLVVAYESSGRRDVGFGIMFPDMEGSRIVLHTVAVAPEARGSGLAAWIIRDAVMVALARGFERAVVALVDESFAFMGRIAPSTRTHALYARPLA